MLSERFREPSVSRFSVSYEQTLSCHGTFGQFRTQLGSGGNRSMLLVSLAPSISGMKVGSPAPMPAARGLASDINMLAGNRAISKMAPMFSPIFPAPSSGWMIPWREVKWSGFA